VRTGTRKESGTAADAAAGAPTGADPTGIDQPVSATQSIPTGTNRAVQADRTGGAVPPAATPDLPAASPPATGSAARTTAVGAKKSAAAGAKKPAKAPADAKATSKTSGRGPRRARLQLRHVDTWSAFKISFVLSIALFFIWMVAVGVLYGVLGGLGVFDTLNDLFGQLGTASGGDGGGVVITPGVIFGAAAVIGAINIILLTALGTVATFIYNLCSDLVGGLELTLSERD
jgi:hypothetical protein